MKKTVAYLLVAFGNPRIELKQRILVNNLDILSRYFDVDLYVNAYDDTEIPATQARNVYIHRQPGILSHLIMDGMQPEKFRDYDYVYMTLDDVELFPDTDWAEVERVFERCACDILSLALHPTSVFSHKFMLQRADLAASGDVRMMKFMEFFDYIMRPSTYAHYYTFLSRDNEWMWGMDAILRPVMGFKNIALFDKYTVKHHVHGTFCGSDPGGVLRNRKMHAYFAHYNYKGNLFAGEPVDRIEKITP